VDLHLSHCATAVHFYGDLRDPELICNLLVHAARDDARKHFPLAHTQTSIASRQCLKIGLAREYLATSIKGGASSAQQQRFVQGFGNEFYSAGLDGEYGRA
jgi:hypothetical protein